MDATRGAPVVVSVSRDGEHRFSKRPMEEITLIERWGVEGDAHAGATVKHRSRVAEDPLAPNLRQVHLLHEELFDEVAARGYRVLPGQMGENITTRGIALLDLPTGAVLRFGGSAAVQVTGLRNPCVQINGLESGLMKQMVGRDAEGNTVRKAGIMAVVLAGGVIRPGDPIRIDLPGGAHEALQPV